MEKLNQYIALTVVACLAILAAGWFLLVSPKRTEAADVGAQADAQAAANSQLETQLQVLRAQAKDLPKKQAELARVAAKIPDNQAMPPLIRALVAAAGSTGIELVSIAPGTPIVAAPPPVVPVASPAPGAPTPAAAPAPEAAAGQLARIPVTLSVVGGYFQVAQFMSALENLPRAMRVTNLTLAPGANPVKPLSAGASSRTLATSITGEVFMAVNRAPITPVAPAPAGQAGGATPTASATPSTSPSA